MSGESFVCLKYLKYFLGITWAPKSISEAFPVLKFKSFKSKDKSVLNQFWTSMRKLQLKWTFTHNIFWTESSESNKVVHTKGILKHSFDLQITISNKWFSPSKIKSASKTYQIRILKSLLNFIMETAIFLGIDIQLKNSYEIVKMVSKLEAKSKDFQLIIRIYNINIKLWFLSILILILDVKLVKNCPRERLDSTGQISWFWRYKRDIKQYITKVFNILTECFTLLKHEHFLWF